MLGDVRMNKNQLREIALKKRRDLNQELRNESDLAIQKHAYDKIRNRDRKSTRLNSSHIL